MRPTVASERRIQLLVKCSTLVIRPKSHLPSPGTLTEYGTGAEKRQPVVLIGYCVYRLAQTEVAEEGEPQSRRHGAVRAFLSHRGLCCCCAVPPLSLCSHAQMARLWQETVSEQLVRLAPFRPCSAVSVRSASRSRSCAWFERGEPTCCLSEFARETQPAYVGSRFLLYFATGPALRSLHVLTVSTSVAKCISICLAVCAG